MKSYFKSKTLWTNFAIGFLGIVGGLLRDAPMDPGTVGMILGGIGAVNMFLRTITDEAVG